MGASAAGIPSSPDEQPRPGLRASDAERDEVAARLRDEYVAGRLSHDTFVHRMDAVLAVRQRADLPPLVADLPAHSPAAPRPLTGWIRDAFSRLTGRTGRVWFSGPPGRTGAPGAVPGAVRGQPPAGPRLTGPRSNPALPIPAGPARPPGGAVRPTAGLPLAGDLPSPLSLRFPRVTGGEFSIGRDASCDLAIPDMTVSRRHATLERTPGGWLISDLASTNGTRVNGWRVRGKVAVRPGDLISFGNLEAVVAREDREDRDGQLPPAVPPVAPPAVPPVVPPADSPAPRP